MFTFPAAMILAIASGSPASSGPEATASLTLKTSGAVKGMGYYPQRIELSSTKPETLKKVPDGLKAPLYGVIKFGPAPAAGAKSDRVYHVVIDEPDGADARLFVDTNGNGDLSDDPAPEWKSRTYKTQDGKEFTQYMGGADLQTMIGAKPENLHINAYRFDKNDTGRAQLKNTMFYYRDYAFEGDVSLGGKTYKALLSDEMTTGDFRGVEPQGDGGSGVKLFVDVNGNGKYDTRGESFDIRAPFNIGGTTYEIKDMASTGDTFKIVKSDKQVDAIATPPDHSVGRKITAFDGKSMDGKSIKFPGDYKGKVVMLDFWATWCGPCMMEVPNLVKVYNQYHGHGFEILGITFDNANADDKIKDVMKDKGMTWTQIYEGKGWKTHIGSDMYAINSIPTAFLVDGDTGEILATGNDLRGEKLEPTLKKVLDRNK
jgi:thiol-disulfide isomerase/thioredoxin